MSLFSDNMFYFAKKVSKTQIYYSPDMNSLKQFIDAFITIDKLEINSLDKLKGHIKGYLKLVVQQQNGLRRLAKVEHEGINMSTLIQGFMLDTTWHIMPYYVTSILMASSFNIGVPLAFSFGHGETRNIYTELLGTLHDQLNYSFEQKIIESDQGSALKSAINEYY